MVDSSSSSSSSPQFLTKHWEGFKEFWGERFSFLDHYSKFIKRDKPLPSWSDADVEAFIASDPIHGPALKTAREAAKFVVTRSVIGAVSTAGITWKYSRSLHGSGLAFLAGGVLVGYLDRKLQTTHFNFTGSTPWLHKLSSWNGGKARVCDSLKHSLLLQAMQ